MKHNDIDINVRNAINKYNNRKNIIDVYLARYEDNIYNMRKQSNVSFYTAKINDTKKLIENLEKEKHDIDQIISNYNRNNLIQEILKNTEKTTQEFRERQTKVLTTKKHRKD